MTRPPPPLFCAVCGSRIHTYDYKVRNGLPLHDTCFEKPPAGLRVILCVRFDQAEAESASWTKLGRANVRVVREKVRAESTWRWGWIVVADAVAANDLETP